MIQKIQDSDSLEKLFFSTIETIRMKLSFWNVSGNTKSGGKYNFKLFDTLIKIT